MRRMELARCDVEVAGTTGAGIEVAMLAAKSKCLDAKVQRRGK